MKLHPAATGNGATAMVEKQDLRNPEPVQVMELRGPGGASWYVEVQPTEKVSEDEAVSKAPPGTELIGADTRLSEAIKGMTGMLDAAASLVSDALAKHRPAEIEVELNIGFTGSVKPVPFLVGAEAKAAMKVKAKWKRPEAT